MTTKEVIQELYLIRNTLQMETRPDHEQIEAINIAIDLIKSKDSED